VREWLLYLRSPTVVNRVLVFCWPYLWRVQPVLILLVCVFLAHCGVNTNVHTSCQKLLSTTQEVLIYHILRFKSTTVYLNISCNVVWELQCPSTTEETINMFGSFNDFSVFVVLPNSVYKITLWIWWTCLVSVRWYFAVGSCLRTVSHTHVQTLGQCLVLCSAVSAALHVEVRTKDVWRKPVNLLTD